MAANMTDLFGESEDDDDDFAPPFSDKAQKSQGVPLYDKRTNKRLPRRFPEWA